MDTRKLVQLVQQVIDEIDKPVDMAQAAHLGMHAGITYWLDSEGSRRLDELLSEIRVQIPDATRYHTNNLRQMVVEAVLSAGDAALPAETTFQIVADQLSDGTSFEALKPLRSPELPLE